MFDNKPNDQNWQYSSLWNECKIASEHLAKIELILLSTESETTQETLQKVSKQLRGIETCISSMGLLFFFKD